MRRPRSDSADSHPQRQPYTAANFQSALYGLEPRIAELQYLRARLGPAEALIAQSQPLVGSVFTEQGPLLAAEASVVFDVGTVLHRFGTWVVTDDGIACLVHHYPLTAARLREQQDWASHLAEQPWVNLWDLLRALVVEQHVRSQTTSSPPSGDSTHPG